MIHLSYEAERIDRITQHNRPFVITNMEQIASLASGTHLGMGFHINGRDGFPSPCCPQHVCKAVRAGSTQRPPKLSRSLIQHEYAPATPPAPGTPVQWRRMTTIEGLGEHGS